MKTKQFLMYRRAINKEKANSLMMKKLFQYLFPAFFLLFGIFFLTPYFQSPDGGEMVLTAANGGVIHPPGYPLQMFLNKLFFFFGKPIHLSFMSLLAITFSGIFLFKILQNMKVDKLVSTVIMVAFLLNPQIFHFSLQPSKYTVAICIQLLFLLFSIKVRDLKDCYLLSIFLGLLAAQHLINFSLIGVLAYSIFKNHLLLKWKKYHFITILYTTLIPLILCYLMLLFFKAPVYSFPDWGKIQSISDLFNLITRTDLKAYNLKLLSLSFDQPHNALIQNLKNWLVELPLYLVSILFLLVPKKGTHIGQKLFLVSPLIFILIFLLMNNHSPEIYWRTQDERWGLLAIPYLYLLSAFALGQLHKTFPFSKRILVVLMICSSLIVTLFKWDRINVHNSNLIHVYLKSIQNETPATSFYISHSDEQFLLGLPLGNEDFKRRFPLSSLKASWYKRWSYQYIKPQIPNTLNFQSLKELTFKLYHQGHQIVSTEGNIIAHNNKDHIKRGPVYITQKNIVTSNLNKEFQLRWKSSQLYCKELLNLKTIPVFSGHFYHQFILEHINNSFLQDALFFKKKHFFDHADLLIKVAKQLIPSQKKEDLHQACKELINKTIITLP